MCSNKSCHVLLSIFSGGGAGGTMQSAKPACQRGGGGRLSCLVLEYNEYEWRDVRCVGIHKTLRTASNPESSAPPPPHVPLLSVLCLVGDRSVKGGTATFGRPLLTGEGALLCSMQDVLGYHKNGGKGELRNDVDDRRCTRRRVMSERAKTRIATYVSTYEQLCDWLIMHENRRHK